MTQTLTVFFADVGIWDDWAPVHRLCAHATPHPAQTQTAPSVQYRQSPVSSDTMVMSNTVCSRSDHARVHPLLDGSAAVGAVRASAPQP